MEFTELPYDVLFSIFNTLCARELALVAATCSVLLRAPTPVEEVLMRRSATYGRAIAVGSSPRNASRVLYIAWLAHIDERHTTIAVGLTTGLCITESGSLMECTLDVPWTDRRGSAPTRLQLKPLRQLAGVPIRSVATGFGFAVAVSMAGCVYTWGECRARGVLGHGGDGEQVWVPKRLNALDGHRMLSVAAGPSHCIAAAEDGTAWSWGLNACGQCGHGTLVPFVDVPRAIQLPAHIRIHAASGGFDHSLMLSSDGVLFFTGRQGTLELANGVPVAIEELRDHRVVATSAGLYHSLALSATGVVFAWGSNSKGQLGNEACTSSTHPEVVDGVHNAHAISAGGQTSCAVTTDGALCMWGSEYGPLPTRIGCGHVVAVSVGATATVVTGSSGCAFGWRN